MSAITRNTVRDERGIIVRHQWNAHKVNPLLAQTHEVAQLTRENDRLRRQLAQAHTIIDVQKKVSSLLGLLTDEKPQGAS